MSRSCTTCHCPLADLEFVQCRGCDRKRRLINAMAMIRSWQVCLAVSQEVGDLTLVEQCTAEIAEARQFLSNIHLNPNLEPLR